MREVGEEGGKRVRRGQDTTPNLSLHYQSPSPPTQLMPRDNSLPIPLIFPKIMIAPYYTHMGFSLVFSLNLIGCRLQLLDGGGGGYREVWREGGEREEGGREVGR